ncbi:transposase [Methylobacterium sp. J-067]|uniref:transposase n=1 Tax=Methylobacterium sp. J-067 TaxID=2836648 RepID=UPI00391BD9DA
MSSQIKLYWLSDEQWAVIAPHLPHRSHHHLDDRSVLSAIVYVSLTGTRWPDCPRAYGSHSSIYNRFSMWRHRPFWFSLLAALSEAGWPDVARALDPVAMTRSRGKRRGLRVDRNWRSQHQPPD